MRILLVIEVLQRYQVALSGLWAKKVLSSLFDLLLYCSSRCCGVCWCALYKAMC